MHREIRIPIFDNPFLFNVYEELDIRENIPDFIWIDSGWKPEKWTNAIGGRFDGASLYELHRLLKYETCPFCCNRMEKVIQYTTPNQHLDIEKILICMNCFYWGGRGTRTGGPLYTRGCLGRIRITNNPDDANINLLIRHLTNNIDKIIDLNPKQAEKILPEILKDVLNCEVKAIGGVKDDGIDALALRSEKEKIIIQIKWREKREAAESVSVVREVGGTLLARGIPSGIIISTRKKFSLAAQKEAKLISQNHINQIGKIDIQLKDFNDLIDMFEISCRAKEASLRPEDIINNYSDIWDF